MIKLTGLFTYNPDTKEEHELMNGTVWTNEQYGSKPYRWGLTPNSRYFYYYEDEGIHFWDLTTYSHLYRKMPFNTGFGRVSVSDLQSVMQGYIGNDVCQVFINNITGAELYRVTGRGNPEYFYTANELVSIDHPRATVTFWQVDSAEMKQVRSVVLDTLYMTDGPMDNNERFKIEVISPEYAAVYNQYDRLYVMGLDYGKSHIVYSDIQGHNLAIRESDAAIKKAKEDCKRNEDAVKFKKGTSITLKGTPYIISSFDCYTNKYSITTVKPYTENPPYSGATILRYNLKPVKKLAAITETIPGNEMTIATLSSVQYEFCGYCRGAGGRWVSDAVTGPVVLLNSGSLTGEYKPLGSMVYNYTKCAVCNGNCWHTK